jgi:hypothetical protein
MKYQRAVLPPRTDLRSWRKRVAARVMVRGLDLAERLMSRMLVEVTPPADDPFYRVPENLEAFCPGEVLDGRPVEVRGFRRLVKADAWQVKFRSTDARGAAVSGSHHCDDSPAVLRRAGRANALLSARQPGGGRLVVAGSRL